MKKALFSEWIIVIILLTIVFLGLSTMYDEGVSSVNNKIFSESKACNDFGGILYDYSKKVCLTKDNEFLILSELKK